MLAELSGVIISAKAFLDGFLEFCALKKLPLPGPAQGFCLMWIPNWDHAGSQGSWRKGGGGSTLVNIKMAHLRVISETLLTFVRAGVLTQKVALPWGRGE